ncbi:MAG: winged helix-turn-helix transcriptional regulator [Nanoarchaeota archaeon]|nr:winged helix-turn-helix transcriptional regulator [Nanoarchaeota archaeon]
MKCKSYETFFVNFANKSKLDIIMALRFGPLNVSTIAKRIGEEQSAVSHNLKKLTDCHVLDVKKAGKERIYSLNKDTVIPILKLVEKHVTKQCPGNCCKK